MSDEQNLKLQVACELSRAAILNISGFTCTHDTEINPETLNYTGNCCGCPVIEAESGDDLAANLICGRERYIEPL